MCARSGRLFLFLVLLAPASAAAQDEGVLPPGFSSDRPGFANTSAVAAREHLTTEIGVVGAFEDPVSSGVFPNLSMRVGLFEWLEARVRGPFGVMLVDDGDATFGLADPWLGFKVGGRLADSLSVSSVFEVSIPIGTDGFGAPEALFFADLNVDWSFWGPLTLTPNAVASVIFTDPDPVTGEVRRQFEGGFSLKLTWQIIDVVGVYVQSYVLASETSDWRVQVGGGLMWMVAPNVQVDASFDIGVTEQGDPPTAGLGTTILW